MAGTHVEPSVARRTHSQGKQVSNKGCILGELGPSPVRPAELESHVNGRFSNRRLRIVGSALPSLASWVNAKRLVGRTERALAADEAATQERTAQLPCWEGEEVGLSRIQSILAKHEPDIHGCIIFGSRGDGSACSYSDVDALVFVHQSTFMDRRRLGSLGASLAGAAQAMRSVDPLQHHGWFAAPECWLSHWPEHYLPLQSLFEGAWLVGPSDRLLRARGYFSRRTAAKNLAAIARAILRDLRGETWRTSLYGLKATVSKIMLIPAILVSVTDGYPANKRTSFERAAEILGDLYLPIEQASAVRAQWPEVRPTVRQRLLTSRLMTSAGLHRRAGGAVPSSMAIDWLEADATEQLCDHCVGVAASAQP